MPGGRGGRMLLGWVRRHSLGWAGDYGAPAKPEGGRGRARGINTCLAPAMAKGAVPFSRFCEKGTVPFAATEKGTAPVSKQPETGAAPFSPPR